MSLSANFTVNTVAIPAEFIAAYTTTVALALTSITGADSITWTILACSKSGDALPTLTPAGTPLGSTASFPMPADPGDGLGRCFLVQCRVTNTLESAIAYAVVGALSQAGILPIVVGEQLARNATHGWSQTLNLALSMTALGSLTIASTVAAPRIKQADKTVNSGTGETLTIQAQNETGTASTGGALVLQSGTGTSAAGPVTIKVGATSRAIFPNSGAIQLIATEMQLDADTQSFRSAVGSYRGRWDTAGFRIGDSAVANTTLEIGASADTTNVNIRVNGKTATTANAGANGAPPAQVEGYLSVNIKGTERKIPYYVV